MSVIAPEHAPALQPGAELPALRLLPVPVCEPPYDDELPGHSAHCADARSPAAAGPLRGLTLLRLVTGPDEDDEPTAPAPQLSDLPPVRPVAQALVQGLLEVLGGVRPVHQLRRATSTELFEQLEDRLHARPRATGPRPGTGAVRSLHVQERPGVAEVCATVSRGGRAAALAMRLEWTDGRWRFTQLVGLEDPTRSP